MIYKELEDFRSGARVNAVMSPFAVNLTDQDLIDLASYYGYLPRLPAYHPEPQRQPTRIVVYGAPSRGIAPCGPATAASTTRPAVLGSKDSPRSI